MGSQACPSPFAMVSHPPDQRSEAAAIGSDTDPRDQDPAGLSTEALVQQLRRDRLGLLRQIDSGRWPQWRLDLAALERELGLLLDQLADQQAKG